MGHHPLRDDKTCQNCGHKVSKRFCPECGQENTETRQPFHYLLTHFVEDLVHYDGSFWKTLKTILFKPGILTKEYLEGKRKKYVAPVKLYIFLSFFVFFVGGILLKIIEPKDIIKESNNNFNYGVVNVKVNDSVKIDEENVKIRKPFTLKEYDSIQSSLPIAERDNSLSRYFNRKLAKNSEKYSEKDLWLKLGDSFKSNFQKFLFFYMPIFAFFMWLFHSKKRWYFFDHGIFTLHYFSFLLLGFFLTISILEPLSGKLQHWAFDLVLGLIAFIIYLWIFIYFFKAHRRTYGYSRKSTFFRGMFILFVNSLFFSIGMLIYSVILFYNL